MVDKIPVDCMVYVFPRVQEYLKAGSPQEERIIIRHAAGARQTLRNWVRTNSGVRIEEDLPFNLVVLRASPACVSVLTKLPEVEFIDIDRPELTYNFQLITKLLKGVQAGKQIYPLMR